MSTSPIPKVRDDDPEDVSWALSTAATSFARGDRAEALKWLRRAAEAASEADRDARALELAKAAADLSPPSMPPKPVPTPAKSAPKQPPPKPAEKTPTPAPVKRPSKADDTSKRGAVRSRPRSLPPSDERTVTYVTSVTKLDAKPPHADADAWPTEAMGSEDLDALGEVYGQERTRIGSPAYQPDEPEAPAEPPAPEVRFSQAVHVVVWRDADGTLRIAPRGTAVSAVTIDALLVAPAPDVDLIAWLSR
ncbi:MAG TPA: hypothetical protein VGH28_19770 [Polyangiaceae bacterium]|jgi:hypothetical protein